MARQTLRIGRDEFTHLIDVATKESWLSLIAHAIGGGGFPDEIGDEEMPIYHAGRLAMAIEINLTIRYLLGMTGKGVKPPREVIAEVLGLDLDDETDVAIVSNVLDQVIGSLGRKVEIAEEELDGASFEEVFGDGQ